MADHFIFGDRPAPKPEWYDREAWAMRVGVIAPGVRLLQTVEKWSCQRLAGEGIVGVSAAHDYLAGSSTTSFVVGWNYLVGPPDRSSLFEGAAKALGEEARLVVVAGQRVLCLRTTQVFTKPLVDLAVAAARYGADPWSNLVDTFVRTEPSLRARTTEIVVGLWTPEHGFVHTGHLTFALADAKRARVELEATGRYNLLDARWTGPCAGFQSLLIHQRPLRMTLREWPFASSPAPAGAERRASRGRGPRS